MNSYAWIAVGGGAAVGAWLRWGLSLVLNPVFPSVPLGTVTSNLVAGFLMGIAMELMARYTAIPPELKLLMTTGFLGGLSTFSTFSGEVVTLLAYREYVWSAILIGIHVIGSVALTVLGIATVRLILSAGTT